MRNTMPLLSRPPQAGPSQTDRFQSSALNNATPTHQVPTIRFIAATPSEANTSLAAVAPFSSSPLAPRHQEGESSSRKRLVPKKSKLGLLGSKTKEKVNKDFSDVVRRVGADTPSTGKGGFEIYVDHDEDADMGSIVVVKKKKSRLGLDGMKWGALGEVTNVPSVPKEKKSSENLLKVKGDENQKWWSIGRGRKESKEKEKSAEEKSRARSKTPEPFKPVEARARFNSLDAGLVLSSASELKTQPQPQRKSSMATLLGLSERSQTPSAESGFLAPPTTESNTGSIAVRAMRSVRSLARMKSWANMGPNSDKEGNNNNNASDITNTNTTASTTVTSSKAKEKSEEKKKKKTKKEKEKEGGKKEKKSVRISGSSFEAGALSSQGSPAPPVKVEEALKKKQSILGLGLPSTMRLGTVRRPSNASSALGVPQQQQQPATMGNRLSAESAHLIMGVNGRPSSTISSGSSLRPPSTASGISAFSQRSPRSSSSSVASVRWDEAGLQHVKERQRRERQIRRESADTQGKPSREGRESRRNSEGRRRAAIVDIFPEARQRPSSAHSSVEPVPPILTVEEATADGHEDPNVSVASTPVRRARPRPVSEQMLSKARPKPVTDDSEGVLSILDAATNDLASLINRLDLEATPASRNNSPLNRSPISLRRSPSTASLGMPGEGSPSKARYTFNKDTDAPLLQVAASRTSLRPYAAMQSSTLRNPAIPANRQQGMDPIEHRKLIGQQIVPWSALDWQVSPKKPTIKPSSTFRPGHRRTLTPAPAVEPPVVLQPLFPSVKKRVSEIESLSATNTPVGRQTPSNPSSRTFGSGEALSKAGIQSYATFNVDKSAPPSPSPVVKRTTRHSRKASVLSAICDSGTILPPEALKSLGLTGTLGGMEPEINVEDPDSDIPDELQTILSGQSDDESVHAFDDTLSYKAQSPPPTPGMPPLLALPSPQMAPAAEERCAPVFRATLIDDHDHEADVDESMDMHNEDDTSKSFDFTGELQKLNDSGASDRRSFVEQLENAFRTPARVDLGFELGRELFVNEDVPPLPSIPLMHRETPGEDIVPRSVTNPDMSSFNDIEPSQDESQSFRDSAASDTLDHLIAECEEDICMHYPAVRRSQSSMRSKESDGKLNTSFRFGGKQSMSDMSSELSGKPLTLSDIIPPLSHQPGSNASFVEEDSSVLKSILAQAYEDDTSVVQSIIAEAADVFPAPVPAPQPRPRLDSTASSKRLSRDLANLSNLSKNSSHSRNTSEASFTGFDSFDEVRRGFEFGPNRPTFYPPPGATSRAYHNRHESVYSIASISSYGAVMNAGTVDPFGYASSRPVSDDMSMTTSLNVDDTFSFLKKDPRRKRVDSDASSYYFRGAASSNPHRRSHRRNDSALSVTSNVPPISLYNRSFGVHRRTDSNSSASSVAHSYAMHGSFGGRAAWARHRQEPSADSNMSDYFAARISRPDIGDKMFDTDYGMALSAISGSPAESTFSDRYHQQTAYDSIFDGETNEPKTSIEDSIFEKTGYKTTYAEESDNVFDLDRSDPQEEAYARLRQFRPVSMLSIASMHTAPKEDDTMISMLGGGHVRRRSIDSGIEGSPCINLERKKNTALQHLARVLRFDQYQDELAAMPDRLSKVSPEKVVLQKPSIASTSSQHFGGERMIMARKGLLERPSLDDSALIAQGDEILHSLQSTRVFSRPAPAGRSRSSTCTSSSGAETPPLSASDNSSVSSGSQSSIDLGHLNTLLTNVTYPSSGIARARTVRARARGTGHRRGPSQAHVSVSRTSVYETIEEESVILSSSPSPGKTASPATVTKPAPAEVPQDSVFIVDADSATYEEHWDEESGVMTMRRYFALREEAQETVIQSKRVWEDTPFSVFAVQSFQPPHNKTGMQALLEHSKQNYGPIPSELRPHRVRSRTSSRPTPYPIRQHFSVSPEQHPAGQSFSFHDESSVSSMGLREISINPNITILSSPPTLEVNPFSPFAVEMETSKPDKSALGIPRQRVSSSARRTALGWSKRTTGKSSTGKSSSSNKENANKENVSQGSIIMHSDSLRLSRPRPRGRPTPARKAVPAI
ncbi:hypothetical protein BC835DRAFT_853465 [Cytidiella melzeri]|nr:hypothetical protein BC835DRAFT_853465 [Cytidiella melzeri]